MTKSELVGGIAEKLKVSKHNVALIVNDRLDDLL